MEPLPRTFTPEEAEALLPEVDALLAEARGLASQLSAAEEAADAEQLAVRANGKVHPEAAGDTPEAKRRAVGRELNAVLERIQAMGVVVRDIEAGLIDFPSVRQGRIVHLCWRRGEPQAIRFWHEVSAGFAGRQAL